MNRWLWLACAIPMVIVAQQAKQSGAVLRKMANDSPIIISDGSTRVKHKGALHDFQTHVDSGHNLVAVVTGPDNTGWKLVCGTGFNCPGALPNGGSWTLETRDNAGKVVFSASVNQNVVTGKFSGAEVSTGEDADNDEAKGGTTLRHPSAFFSISINGAAPVRCSNAGADKATCVVKILHTN